MVRAASDGVFYERWVNGVVRAVASPTPPSVNEWHHFVSVFDGAMAYVFLDGGLVSSDSVTNALVQKSNPYVIGRQNCSPCSGSGYLGDLDEVAIYDKALTATRIQAHYDAAK